MPEEVYTIEGFDWHSTYKSVVDANKRGQIVGDSSEDELARCKGVLSLHVKVGERKVSFQISQYGKVKISNPNRQSLAKARFRLRQLIVGGQWVPILEDHERVPLKGAGLALRHSKKLMDSAWAIAKNAENLVEWLTYRYDTGVFYALDEDRRVESILEALFEHLRAYPHIQSILGREKKCSLRIGKAYEKAQQKIRNRITVALPDRKQLNQHALTRSIHNELRRRSFEKQGIIGYYYQHEGILDDGGLSHAIRLHEWRRGHEIDDLTTEALTEEISQDIQELRDFIKEELESRENQNVVDKEAELRMQAWLLSLALEDELAILKVRTEHGQPLLGKCRICNVRNE